MQYIKWIGLLLMLVPMVTFAAFPNRLIIVGKVTKIRKDVVTLRTKTGSVKVPKIAILKKRSLRPGRTVKAKINLQQLYYFNR